MTNKELRRLSRSELLQLLLDQVQENEQLKSQVSTLMTQLNQQRITCDQAGSIAEAALALTSIFQDADQAARKYLQEVEVLTARQEQELRNKADLAREQAARLVSDALDRAAGIRKEAEDYLADAKEKARKLLEEAKQDADAYWEEIIGQGQLLMNDKDRLKTIAISAGENKDS